MKIKWNVAAKVLLVGALVMNSFAVVHSYQGSKPWRPLGTYPVPQLVADKSLTVNDTVDVTAIKCNNTKNLVMISGSSQFQRPDKREVIFPVATGGVGVRQPGCKTLHFQNPIPLEVKNYVNAQKEPVPFQIDGSDTPLKTNCDLSKDANSLGECQTTGQGESKSWFTEVFTIAPSK